MRWMHAIWVLGLLLVVPAGAQDRSEVIKLARAAMEAQLRIGDLLHERGDYAGALEAYRKAIAIYEGAVHRAPSAAVLRAEEVEETEEVEEIEEVPEEEEIVEVPIEGDEEILEEPDGEPSLRRVRLAQGKATTENAVDLGLQWLADHQDEDGRWDTDDFMKHDPADDKCDGPGGALHDVGLTGLATLAFLGAGYTHQGDDNPHAKTVARALHYLLSVQVADGLLGKRVSHSFMYSHTIGTLALCEAYSMTRDPRLAQGVKKAVDFIQKARNPYLAWRYEPRGGENDTSVTAWCVAVLRSAQRAGLDVDPANFTGAVTWFDKMTDPNFGQAGYNFPGGTPARMEGMQDRFPPEKSQAMTAAALFVRVLCG